MGAFQISLYIIIVLGIADVAMFIKYRSISRKGRELRKLDAAVIKVSIKGRREARYQATADLPNRCKIVTGPYPKSNTAKRKLEKTAIRYGFTLNWVGGTE